MLTDVGRHSPVHINYVFSHTLKKIIFITIVMSRVSLYCYFVVLFTDLIYFELLEELKEI